MIKARFKYDEYTIIKVSKYFDIHFKEEWITHPMVKDMIMDVDKSEVVNEGVIISPILGPITPGNLSGGVKALILMLFQPEYEYDASQCGDNCAVWIYKISKINDLKLSFGHLMNFPNNIQDLEMEIIEDGRIVNNMEDFLEASIDFLE